MHKEKSGLDILLEDGTDDPYRMRERGRMVFNICKQNSIPVALSRGGGYSEKVAPLVETHINTYRLAQDIFF